MFSAGLLPAVSPSVAHLRSGAAALGAVACARRDGCATIRWPPVSSAPIEADLDTLRRLALRDETALAELFDRHSKLAYSVIMRILRNSSDAEEVLQETFVRVWNRADSYDARLGAPTAWLTRIARNHAIDRLRARRVRSAISVDAGGGAEGEAIRLPEPQTHETPEALMQAGATTGALRAAMAALPEGQRDLIEAAFFEGYTHHELATRFELPLGTVKTRIRTGLTAMRARLEQVA
jgi:RNA polymerase sigma-70 factor, ECF subfamily